ncbi:MAG: hypothetical protein V4662_15970 [Verrucomicrobiota bacterium]
MSASNNDCFASLTLKERVAWFWEWFSASAERFHDAIEARQCSDLQPETSQAIDRWLPHMAWVYGPGENRAGHSLTLSGEGSLPKQFVAEYWQSQAPKIAGWTFYASRQPSGSFDSVTLRLEKEHETFKQIEFWLFPYVNEETERIDITVWHPSIERLPERVRFMALFLMLDELLGEYGTQNWIGEIKFSDELLKRSVPIGELREVISDLQSQQGWKKYSPTETYSAYHLKDLRQQGPRSDTVAGSSRFFQLLGDYFEAHGPCKHPLADLGVDLVYVSIPTKHFHQGDEVNERSAIEDDLVTALQAEAAGISLGGATGRENCYIDLALYDGERSLKLVKRVLRKHRVPLETKIRFFTSDHGREVILV